MGLLWFIELFMKTIQSNAHRQTTRATVDGAVVQ